MVFFFNNNPLTTTDVVHSRSKLVIPVLRVIYNGQIGDRPSEHPDHDK